MYLPSNQEYHLIRNLSIVHVLRGSCMKDAKMEAIASVVKQDHI